MKKIICIVLVFTAINLHAQDKKWTLLECVNYALENNISIKQSELDLHLADIAKKDAIGNFLPTLNANASLGSNTGANVNPATNQFENSTFESANGSISSGINIFNGLANWKTLQRTKLNQIASQYSLDKMKDDTSLFVANSFLQILANREQLRVLRAQNAVTKENIKNTQELVDAGVLPRGDLLEIQATDATQEQQIINAENALIISKIGLAQTLQLKDYLNFDIVDEDYGLIGADILDKTPFEIAEKAKEEVNDVRIAQANLDIAQKDLEISRSNYSPSLSGFVQYSTRWASTQTNPFTGEDIAFIDQLYIFDGTSIGLQLSVPIFNGFSVRNNVERSKVAIERQKYQLEQTQLDLESTVYQAYNDAKNSKKAYEAALKTEEARRLAFEYAKERYDVGLSNAFDFNQSRTAYENSQSDVVRTKYDYIFRLKILEFYFGLPITDLN
ncbi:TolC family protein [Winogradskyella sp. SYSU M77433]|uniref:TolC family protein n=1 Tax=Winogradskyella sp. SYSU M77433 TaxID=3042722 RepID=UPI00248102E8|nr:TolC family protein [Winogradskyella sp. SYSU M77433]MDH7913287.1 TolC family protein [Winogradskyella sp. SYSU M77433]